MDVADEAASVQHLLPSPQALKESMPLSSSSPSPFSLLSHTASSSSSATSSFEDLLTSPDRVDLLDSFLRDALNSRNRISVLRLDLEAEKFVRNPEKRQLLLNPMLSSYERLAAHRVAQHYHVQSMALDSGNPSAPWVLLVKTPDSRLPRIKLADIPFELCSDAKSASPPPGKLAIKQRASEGANGSESTSMGRIAAVRSVEERMEEYNKARARIFSDGDSRIRNDESLAVNEAISSSVSESDAVDSDFVFKTSNTVAVFRDREKDMKDPDYDRNRFLQSTRITSLNSPMIPVSYSSTCLGSNLVASGRYEKLQRQASYFSACDNRGCPWYGVGVSPALGYPSGLPNAFGQSFHPCHSNVHQCNAEYVYPRHYSPADWRQDLSKSSSCSMLSTHHAGWFQNY